jgi:hypothetical protein
MVKPTLAQIREKSPFPWRTQVNCDGPGNVRMVDANGVEVPLFSITGLAEIVTGTIAAQAAATKQGTGT